MKKTLFILIFILSYSYLSQAQQDEGAKDSVILKAQTFFKEVDKIELVELKPYCYIQKYRSRFLGLTKKYERCTEASIIRSNSQLDSTHIGKRYELPKNKFDYIFDLLYNSESSNDRAACYNPRHGIIFYDSTGNINGFLEICFECNQIYSFPETPNPGPPILEKFNELKNLFKE